ncbi:MAG: divalent-cation tolerance protein CutA [Gemmatimonadetes bacterium]|nr:divalent-cation tolerance protein CutA [Gemmatimonadota bacterium]
MTDACIVLVTAPDEEIAAGLCRSLIDEGLVACGNVIPGIRSLYRWRGVIRDEEESLIVFRTHRSRVPELVRRIPEMHPYEVPEVLVLAVEAGHEPYLRWVAEETGSRPVGGAG